MDKNLRMIEINRIVNIAKGFGWTLESSKEADNALTIELKKTVGPSEAVPSVSPSTV